MKSRISADNLTLKHGKVSIIEHLTVSLPEGKVTAIFGPNGFGKTTLLNGLSPIHSPITLSVLLVVKYTQSISPQVIANWLRFFTQAQPPPALM